METELEKMMVKVIFNDEVNRRGYSVFFLWDHLQRVCSATVVAPRPQSTYCPHYSEPARLRRGSLRLTVVLHSLQLSQVYDGGRARIIIYRTIIAP